MTPKDTAKMLLARINAPSGTVSILTEPDPKAGFALRVWVMPNASVEDIPEEFLGHPVIVQRTPRLSPEH